MHIIVDLIYYMDNFPTDWLASSKDRGQKLCVEDLNLIIELIVKLLGITTMEVGDDGPQHLDGGVSLLWCCYLLNCYFIDEITGQVVKQVNALGTVSVPSNLIVLFYDLGYYTFPSILCFCTN
jgi:hypothetical protein